MATTRSLVEPKWLGSKRDPRLYWTVRIDKQRLVREKYERLKPFLDEPSRRLWAANEAMSFGRGGIRAVAQALEMSQETVLRGIRELRSESQTIGWSLGLQGRQRRPGAGRKATVEKEPGIVQAIQTIIGSNHPSESESPLQWTLKSIIQISSELKQQGWAASPTTVGKILKDVLGYGLRGLKNTRQGLSHPNPAAQFEYLNRACRDFHLRQQPVIFLDAKKSLAADRNERCVYFGVDRDMVDFVITSLHSWWIKKWRCTCPDAQQLLIVVNAGSTDSDLGRTWVCKLQELIADLGLTIAVCHLPPGTSRWSKSQHQVSSEITFGGTEPGTTKLSLTIDLVSGEPSATISAVPRPFPELPKETLLNKKTNTGVRVISSDFYGEWNYILVPESLMNPVPRGGARLDAHSGIPLTGLATAAFLTEG